MLANIKRTISSVLVVVISFPVGCAIDGANQVKRVNVVTGADSTTVVSNDPKTCVTTNVTGADSTTVVSNDPKTCVTTTNVTGADSTTVVSNDPKTCVTTNTGIDNVVGSQDPTKIQRVSLAENINNSLNEIRKVKGKVDDISVALFAIARTLINISEILAFWTVIKILSCFFGAIRCFK
ncbi:MAG: hypothetical protein CfP315_0129 [Candidatus Improbicoccus pseudotrichonymphae]|uniref:Uncharacterized protein n=1 Tax=Candidatus Improbicoccus pseudotrichonymphae TaxID=3033792 RepID=A0AA48HXR1_9FIRM|nr:MAG: hypothetical protein CfP315_0129 [Candidatus Improbicoccus pseudotrichonymphae]